MNVHRAQPAPPVKARKRPPQRELLGAVRTWLLVPLVALCVARPLVPSEGAAWLGDDLPFDMLWFALAACYLLWATVRGGLARPLAWVDAPVAALFALNLLAAFVGASHAAPRPAVNMLWAWSGMLLGYFSIRQLVITAGEARALIAAMVALSVIIAAYGYYQVMVSLPADRAAYAANPEEVLQRTLGHAFPPGSPERKQFEDRLQSTEPLATFALTNSLAGFLAPWLIVGLGIFAAQLAARLTPAPADPPREDRLLLAVRLLVLACALLGVAGCLVLTKSRSAYLAVAAGVVLLPWLLGSALGLWRRRMLVAGAGALLLIILAATLAGGLDFKVLSEASKSLGYRAQYWKATLGMIQRHPWLGVGSGSFQDYYTQFKLPEASEEVRDPHNFILETWATAGTFALVALLAVLGVLAWRTWQLLRVEPTAAESEGARGKLLILAGAALGLVVAFLIGPLMGFPLTELQVVAGWVAGAAISLAAWPWIARGTLPAGLPLLGALVMAIHWLAAGGISFPGVAGSFWMLIALALNQAEGPVIVAMPLGRSDLVARAVPLVALLVVVAGAAACHYTAYAPVMRLQVATDQIARIEHPEARAVAYLDATIADPLSAEPWAALAELELEALKRDPKSQIAHRRFLDATRKLMELKPRSSATTRQVGHWFLEVLELTHDPRALASGVECFRAAALMYPNSAVTVADYALALELSGKSDQARRQARRALELDQITPHADKKLSPETRASLARLVKDSKS